MAVKNQHTAIRVGASVGAFRRKILRPYSCGCVMFTLT